MEQVKADGEHQATISKELAEFGLKLTGMLSRPIQWFSDPEWRDGWIETAREPLERYSRINDRLLDGCEEAYAAIAAEFHAEDPNFQQYVDSGALDPQLAMLLEESLAKYAAVGRRPVLEQGRCNAQVLIVDSMSMDTGFTATVVFRSREARDSALISTAQPRARPEGSVATGVSDPHLAKQDEDAQADSMDEQTTMANRNEHTDEGVHPAGEQPPQSQSKDSLAFEDTMQLWTFTSEQPSLSSYMAWIRGRMGQEVGEDSDADIAEPPVRA